MDSRPEFQPNGQAPVSASDGNTSGKGKPPSRGMTIPEIKYLVNEYRTSTKWAREAGFGWSEPLLCFIRLC
jgi:2,4-dienoyl-CoA reductase-like NADH-dependent reductase (Old Yellow Enzyme family)